MSKMSPKDLAHRIGAIAKVLDQPEMARQREHELYVDFIKLVASDEAIPSGVRMKAKDILEVSAWEIER